MVTDLDFGTMLIGRNKTLSLTLCNRGEEIVHFVDSSTSGGGAVITWLDDSFTMTKSVFDRLRRSSLGPDECVGGRVTFHADDTVGSYKTVARLWLNTRRCRDTSIWSVNVVDSARLSAPENHTPTPGLDLADITLDRNGILGFGLFSSEKGEATLRLYDAEGRRVLVRQLGIVRSGASRFEQSIGSLPPGAYILEIDVDRASVARHPILLL